MRLIVFDCDGTLLDSQHMIWEAMRAAFARHDVPLPPRAAAMATIGLSLPQVLERLAPKADMRLRGRLAADYATAFGMLRANGGGEPMFPGMKDLVLRLAATPGTRLGIATGKSRRGVAAFLAREGLEECFATIQTADDAPSKPNPTMLRQAMAAAGRTRPTVMIGDTSYDIAMAKAAGATGIGVAWGHHSPAELMAAGALAVAKDAAALGLLLDLAAKSAA